MISVPQFSNTHLISGIPPNDKDDPGYFMDYTSPAIRFDDGSFMMDSWKIAQGNTSIISPPGGLLTQLI